jgi:hypothetical protein
MPVSGPPSIILSTAAAIGAVVVAFAVLALTRLIVRFAAEPDRAGRSSPARVHRWWRDR